jgi:hypothetical protein
VNRSARSLAILAAGAVAVGGVVCLVRWWDSYWAQYVAQNMLPPSVWTLVGIVIAHVRLHAKLDEHHEDMKAHVSGVAGGRM